MRRFSFFSWLFGAVGICAAVLGIYLGLTNRDAGPVLVEPPRAALERAETMLEAVCAGDSEAVEATLRGNPSLGLDRDPADAVGVLIWDAFAGSMSYALEGECYATDSGVAQDVVFTYLDMDSVTANLRQRSQELLEQRVAQAEDVSEIYDENNDYREDFVLTVLYDAAQAALAEDAQLTTARITLNLVYEQGQWWIVPDGALLAVLSGGVGN